MKAVVGALLLLGATWLLPVRGAGAVALPASGYWVKLGIGLPVTPAHGLVVGDDPTEAVNPAQPPNLPISLPIAIPGIKLPGPQLFGFLAVSALRITGVPDNADVTLTLNVAQPSIPPLPTIATIVACPIVAPWQPPARGVGELGTAPAGDCNTPSVGRLASDDATMTFLLPAAFQQTPGELDIELEPGAAGVPLPFLVSFDAPTPSSINASSGPPFHITPPGAVAPSAAPILGSAPGQVVAPAVTGPAASPSGPVSTPTVQPQTVTFPAPVAAAVRIRDDRAHRVMAVALLLGLVGLWWWVGGRAARDPRRLGALPPPGSPTEVYRLGGVGRFRSARGIPPARLH